MTKIKLINQRIKFYKERLTDIKNCRKVCIRKDQLEELSKEETFYNERLDLFQQIKNTLEAWEVVKSSINLSENSEDYKNRAYLNVINYSDKQWLILKKAVEIKDE